MNIFKLKGHRRALLLVIRDANVQLLTWNNERLSHNAFFVDSDDDRQLFERFLRRHRNFPVILVTDFIEESFKHEDIVHVSVNDRNAILKRKLHYFFRDSVYRTAKLVGRQRDGRRNDNIMFSALTKPELIQPWVDSVLSQKMAIQSISSAAYVLEKYVASHDLATAEDLLLVSLEEQESSFRQTYFKKGKVLFSRLTSLELQDQSAPGADIRQETLHIRKYLERIKLLSIDSHLQFHVLSPYKRETLAPAFRSTDSFDSLRTQDEVERSSVELLDSKATTLVVVLAKVLPKYRIGNTYAPMDVRRYQLLRQLAKGLIVASAILLSYVLLSKVPVFIDTLDKWGEEEQTLTQTTPYLREYGRLTEGFPETPIPSKEMALIVSTTNKIEAQTLWPLDSMNIVSRALLQSPDLQITNLHWSLEEHEEVADNDETSFLGSFGSFGGRPSSAATANAFFNSVVEETLITVITLEGVAFSPNSYRDAQDQVLALVNALAESPGVATVTPVKMPTDVRSDTAVSTTVDDIELRATFTLEIKLEKNDA